MKKPLANWGKRLFRFLHPTKSIAIKLPDFSHIKVLVIGDVMIDRYLDGKVERISPEAPVPVMRLGNEDNRLGGAANVALNIQALGATPILAGVVGNDANGETLRELLAARGLSDQLIVTDASRPTTVKTRLTAGGQQLMRVDREETHDLVGPAAEELLGKIEQLLSGGDIDVTLFQDYNKGVLHSSLTARLHQLCVAAGVATAVDPKNKGFWDYVGCNLFKPNLREIQAQLDFPVSPTLPDLDRAASVVFEKLNCKVVMVTLSEHGIYLNDGKTSGIYPTSAKDIADVSGAGDTVISVAACGLAAGMELPDIARLSNLAGAQVIAKRGVVAVDLDALKAIANI